MRGAFRVSSRGGDESAYREPPRVQNPVRYAEVPTPYSKTSHTVHDPHRADVIMARTWSRGGGRVLDAWQHIVQLSQPRAAPQCGDYHTFGCTRLPVCFYIELGECVCPVGAWACGIHICRYRRTGSPTRRHLDATAARQALSTCGATATTADVVAAAFVMLALRLPQNFSAWELKCQRVFARAVSALRANMCIECGFNHTHQSDPSPDACKCGLCARSRFSCAARE